MSETVTVYALLAFDDYPQARDADVPWLVENCSAAVYALRGEWLPHGGWMSQGHKFECSVSLSVPVDSYEAKSALSNSREYMD